MTRVPHAVCLVPLLVVAVLLLGCPSRDGTPSDDNGEPSGDIGRHGRYLLDAPTPIISVGIIDTPRLVMLKNGGVHLAYLLHDASSQRVWYSRLEDGEFVNPSLLSQAEGTKRGGGYLAEPSPNELIAYYISVSAAGGQLYYKSSSNGGRTFSLERRWNERNEARWPVVMGIDRETVAYFFVHYRDDWELVANRDFSVENESTLDVAQGIPFHLQGLTDGEHNVWLAYFVRRQNADGGRIAFLTSEDDGSHFIRKYLWDDLMIPNVWSFFQIAMSEYDRTEVLHIIFTEESPDLTTIYYSRSEDGGENFTMPIAMIRSEPPLTNSPLLLANGMFVLIVTADATDDGPALRYCFSEDGGESFDAPAVATRQVSAPETFTGLINADGSIMLVWDDLASSAEGGEQLFRLNGSLRGR